MKATDPAVTFLLVLVIGIVAGILFDRLAGPSWLARQFSGSTRGIITSALIGVAGAFVGYHIAMLLALDGGIVAELRPDAVHNLPAAVRVDDRERRIAFAPARQHYCLLQLVELRVDKRPQFLQSPLLLGFGCESV